VKTEPIQTDEGFIGSDILLTKNQSKPNCYTPNDIDYSIKISKFTLKNGLPITKTKINICISEMKFLLEH